VRILFDQGAPAPLRHYLAQHEVSTAAEMAWSALSNGGGSICGRIGNGDNSVASESRRQN
jgi:hypothetical protein